MSANHNHGENADKNIAVAFFLNLSFAVIELAGGLITNSVAILTDALHDLGDALSLAVSWYLQKISKRPRDVKYTYGYKRFSLLGSVVISAVLTFGSLIMITESVKRLITPEKTDAKGMLYLALLGITINGFAALRMKRGNSFNEHAVFLHFMEDVLGWIAVLIGSILMIYFPVAWFDSAISIGIAVWVLINVMRNLNRVMRVFLQETPVGVDIENITEAIGKIFGVKSIHDLHIWSLDGQSHIMTLHAVIFNGTNAIPIKSAIKETSHIFGIDHTTVEIETELELCAAELEHNIEGEKHDH
jgi:cobalt-zinc-cadmium efflux system protein